MAITVNKVQDANIYINGTSTFGQAAEVQLPTLQFSKNEFKHLGTLGVFKLANGAAVEALEATIKWNYPENDVQVALANPLQAVELQIRSNKMVFTDGSCTDEQPIIVYLKGTSNNHDLGNFKAKEDTDLNTKLDVYYVKEIVNGREIVEIDIPNAIYRIDGTDILAAYKKNLGI